MAELGLGFSAPASYALTSRQPLPLLLLEHFHFPCPVLLLCFLPSNHFCLHCQTVLSPRLEGPLLLVPLTPFHSPDVFSYLTYHGEHIAFHEQEVLVLFQLLSSPIVLHLQTQEGLRNNRGQREKLLDTF